MSVSLNNVTTTDGYTQNNTVSLQADRVNIQVYNASVFIRHTGWNREQWAEEFLAPGKYSFDRQVLTTAVRSAVPGTPAQVTITMLPASETGQ